MKNTIVVGAAAGLVLSFAAGSAGAGGRGDGGVVFRADFSDANALKAWQGDRAAPARGADGSACILLTSPEPGGTVSIRRPLPVERLRGKLVTVSARVRAEGVQKPPKHWNGIKLMLALEMPHGRQWPQVRLAHGTFGWTTVRETLRLPATARSAAIVLGLEKVSGKVWFDDVTVRVGRPVAGGRRLKERFRGHGLPRLRGVMHGPDFEEKDLRDLAAWGANHVRWQLNWRPMKAAEAWAADLDRYDRWLAGALQHCDRALDACEKLRIRVLLDLHCPPGGRAEGGVCRMLTEKRHQEKFVDVWRMLARRYKGRKIIYAYDLINEPVQPSAKPEGLLSWPELFVRAARAVREIEPGKPVVYEPGPWGGCRGFDRQVPVELDRVIYSFHMYQPHEFTHQFRRGVALTYPGVIAGETWDKRRLREAMLPAIEFQKAFNCHMYVGEFSASRGAPNDSAWRYLRDCIELFEELGWDWSYHAYREWHGWSVEHTTDRTDTKPSATPTKRQKLLQSWFAKNKR